METYSVKQLSKLAGVSIRTLHHYDELGLLKPLIRSESGYRRYGEKELMRLQQILFYRELDFELREIKDILDDPDYDLLEGLLEQRQMLQVTYERTGKLLQTIEKTIKNLEGGTMLSHEELYEGFSKEQAKQYRREATQKWGDAVTKSESYLKKLSKEEFKQLKEDAGANWRKLASLCDRDPSDADVQQEIEKHYSLISTFWGTAGDRDSQFNAYMGLGELYVHDERYTRVDGVSSTQFAGFMRDAMRVFVDARKSEIA